MKLLKLILAMTTISILISCSDETLDRDEVTLKAVYQEYNLTYNMENKTVDSSVYFRTSAYGSFVQLSDSDKIEIKVESSEMEDYKELKKKKEQVYLGSRNVPYYSGGTSLKTINNNEVSWVWYDSETDQTITTSTKLFHPEIFEVSHNQEKPLDTLNDGELTISLKDGLTQNQVLIVRIVNDIDGGSTHYLEYTFRPEENKLNKSFTIASKQMREDSDLAETKNIETTKKKYGNLNISVTTEKNVPVLTAGRKPYRLEFSVLDTVKTTNLQGKGGVINSYVTFPVADIDIIF